MRSPFYKKRNKPPKLSPQIILNESTNRFSSNLIINPYDSESSRIAKLKDSLSVNKLLQKNHPENLTSDSFNDSSSNFIFSEIDSYSFTNSSFSQFKNSSITSSNIERKPRICQNDYCCICELELTTLFSSEEIINLHCGHFAHYDCSVSMSSHNLVKPNDINIHCPKCGKFTFCDEVYFKDKLIKSLLINNDNFEDNDENNFLSTSTPIDDASQDLISNNFPDPEPLFFENLDPSNCPAITPINQTGSQNIEYFKEENFKKILNHDHSSFSRKIKPLLKQSPIISTLPSTPTTQGSSLSTFIADRDFNTEIQVTPEFSVLSLSDTDLSVLPEYQDVNCVLSIKRGEFEPSPEKLNKEEQFKIEIYKTNITNELLRHLENKILVKGELDVSNLGSLILFDLFDIVETNNRMYYNCQLFLFEDRFMILDTIGEIIIINQKVSGNEIASVTEDLVNGTIIVNLLSLKLPEIILYNSIEIIQQKWLRIISRMVSSKQRTPNENSSNDPLKHLSKEITKFKISKTVPLIQMSTNAWGLIANNESIIPNDVLKLNKLVSKGLGLPYRFLMRQIPYPDKIPMTLIMCISLKIYEDCEIDQKEYTQKIRELISSVLEKLDKTDSLGLVFMGLKKGSELGHYYGCASTAWDGWSKILGLIECYTENSLETDKKFKWNEDWKYLEILSGIGFSGLQDSNRIKEIIYIHTDLVSNNQTNSGDKRRKLGTSIHFDHSVEEKTILEKNEISDKLNTLCNKYDANFKSILFSDEFLHLPKDILEHYQNICKGDVTGRYNGRKKQYIALDFENLNAIISNLIKQFHDTSVKRISTEIKVQKGVKLIEVEKNGEMVDATTDSIIVDFSNVAGGFNKLIMFKLRVDLNNIPLNSVRKGCKIDLLSSVSKVITVDGTKNLTENVDIRLCIAENMSSPGTRPLNIVVSNPKDSPASNKSINLSIIPRLSSVRDGICTKRQIEILIMNQLKKSILNQTTFNYTIKNSIMRDITVLTNKIWEETKTCTSIGQSSTTTDIQSWSEEICDQLDKIKDGYGLRFFERSNIKSTAKYLELI